MKVNILCLGISLNISSMLTKQQKWTVCRLVSSLYLKSVKARIQNRQGSLNHSAILQRIYISGMYSGGEMACFGAGSVAGNAFPVYGFLLRGTYPDASPVILQQMFWAISDTGGAISIFSVRIFLPLILDWIISLHGRTFLFANPIIVKIPTSLEEKEKKS